MLKIDFLYLSTTKNMPESVFHFKQFKIDQDRCAMKVGTDGVLLGSWIKLKSEEKVLDVGTGTGLIAIMIAQRSLAQIDAIDIDKGAFDQAVENCANSPWSDRLKVIHASLQEYRPGYRYDLIVSNPPYIPIREKATMQKQVIDFEPEIALFVSDHFPLLFYSKIAQLGKTSLKPNGQLFFEIHFDQGQKILSMLDEMGYHGELQQDIYGKDRMVRASLKN